jgi:hypothetical protein
MGAFWYDLDQGSRLVMLKVKLDSALNRSTLSEVDKSTVRFQIHEFLMSFPVERLWLFFKILRNLRHCDMDDISTRMPELELAGPEDAFIEHGEYVYIYILWALADKPIYSHSAFFAGDK